MTPKQQRPAWHEPYTTPDAESLLGEITVAADETRAVYDAAVALCGAAGVTVEWRGTPWKWTISLCTARAAAKPAKAGAGKSAKNARSAPDRTAGEHPAFIIPNPEEPVLGLAMPRTLADGLDLRKTHKALKDPLMSARQVGKHLWMDLQLKEPAIAELAVGLIEAVYGPAEE